ncbi:hypothetical protein ACEPPN_011946 [Leptodophora sp. 'Broadleaf-Isolate-01']
MADSQIPPVTSSPSASIRTPWTKKDRTKIPSLKNPQELATLCAGKSGNKFVVHKDFACHYSPVLEAAFNGNFIEGQTQEYKFYDTGEEAIRLLVHRLYTQKLDTIALSDPHKKGWSEQRGEAVKTQTQALIELWVLCERLIIPRLQNVIIHEIQCVTEHTNTIPVSCFKYIHENNASNSPLRRIYVDQCVTRFSSDDTYTFKPDRYPHEMLLDMVIMFTKILMRKDSGFHRGGIWSLISSRKI